MAATLTWEKLRELAGFRAENGVAVSLYVDLDPHDAPTPASVEVRVRSLLDEGERWLDARRASLTHDRREGLKRDLERIGSWFEEEFDRHGARGLVLFAAWLDNFWSTLTLSEPVPDALKIEDELYVAPLAPLVGRSDGALVCVVGRERGDVYRLQGRELAVVADQTEEVPGQHDQGGWSQARYERHIEEIVERHWRRLADTLETCVRRLRSPRVVLIGAEDMRSDFEALLSNEVRSCVVGWTTVEAHAQPPRILESAKPVLEAWWETKEAQLIDRWREAAARNGRAAAGWEQTLEAASDGRVELLLVQNGVDRTAYRCPACGRAQMRDGSCPLDGTTMESRDGGLDLAVHQTLVHGGSVHVVRHRQDLEPVGGVAALLRF